jgi:hypothetical protein
LYLRRDGDTWSISRLVKKERQEADRQGPQKPIAIDDIEITNGSVVIDGPVGTSGLELPKRFDKLDAKLNFKYEPVHYSIEITHVSFRGSDPAVALNALSGGVAVRSDTLFVDKLAIRLEETSLSVDGASSSICPRRSSISRSVPTSSRCRRWRASCRRSRASGSSPLSQ